MKADTAWCTERRWLTWIVTRRLWSTFAGSAYEVHKYRNGIWRRFWTKKEAQARADALNRNN